MKLVFSALALVAMSFAFSFSTVDILERGNGTYFCPGCGKWATHPHVCSKN